MISRIQFFIVLSIFIASSIGHAGGPLYSSNGKAYRYQSNVISYKLDRGSFGIFTNSEAQTLANASFAVWNNVASSNVTLQHTDADTLAVDVNGTNYLTYTTLDDFKYDGINPIIFDSDGSITDALFGDGASESVIGFAGSGDNNNDGYFDEGESVMNGLFADGTEFSYTLPEWKATFVHEFGHFLGLDHTQINGEFESVASKTMYVPTMYPFATVNDTPLGDLNPDDIAAISNLYPEASFLSSTGKISGSVTRANSTVVQGANVIAISTGADSLMNQISTVTDYFEQNTGNYVITGLAPGSYTVRIEPINPDFIEGSSVGPFSYVSTGISFQNPVSLEYYNAANESGDPATDNPLEKTSVIVAANTITSGINFVANGGGTGGAGLFNEDFNFSGVLTSNGWSTHSGTANVLSTTTGLSYTGFQGSEIGNAILVSNLGGEDVNKSFEEQSAHGTAIYSSFLIYVNDPASSKTGDYFFHIGNKTPSAFSNFSARTFARIVADNVNFGISNTNTVTYGTTNYSKNTTYLLITKYTINTAGNDEIKLWVLSSGIPTNEGSAGTPEAVNAATAGQDINNAVGIRQGSTSQPQLVLDGIHITTQWPGTLTSVKNIPPHVIPSSIELMQNYPNPFNPTTSIRFALPTSEMVRIKIFDLLGREIALLADGRFDAGVHEIRFDAHHLSSGTYFYSLEAGTHHEIKKMTLLK